MPVAISIDEKKGPELHAVHASRSHRNAILPDVAGQQHLSLAISIQCNSRSWTFDDAWHPGLLHSKQGIMFASIRLRCGIARDNFFATRAGCQIILVNSTRLRIMLQASPIDAIIEAGAQYSDAE